MTHENHDTLPGYHPGQALVDGCGECEARGRDLVIAMGAMDVISFERAWVRASEWQRRGGTVDGSTLSEAEVPLLRALWGVQVQLERRGVPLGSLPWPSA